MSSPAIQQAAPLTQHSDRGIIRWAVHSASWQPTQQDFDRALGLLPDSEHKEVTKFVRVEDRHRAVLSRLLQYAAAMHVLGCAPGVVMLRTKGRKPFVPPEVPRPVWAPNFNFNVSHEGEYVVLAAETHCLCGTDVAAPQQLRRGAAGSGSLWQAVQRLRPQFSPQEWQAMKSCGSDEALMEAAFQRLWSCKEAFIKARGDGLGFEPLSRAEFTFSDTLHGPPPSAAGDGSGGGGGVGSGSSSSIGGCAASLRHAGIGGTTTCGSDAGDGDRSTGQQRIQDSSPWDTDGAVQRALLRLDDVAQPRWRFFVQRLGSSHWVTVARGPPDAAVDAHGVFRGTLSEPHIDDVTMQGYLAAPSPPFSILSVGQLLHMAEHPAAAATH